MEIFISAVLFSMIFLSSNAYALIQSVSVEPVYGNYNPGDIVSVTFTLENNGAERDRIYVEACVYPEADPFSVLPLEITPEPSSCCTGNEFCNGGFITLNPGERETFTLRPRVPTPKSVDNCGVIEPWKGEGRYKVVLLSVDQCCWTPSRQPQDCQGVQPWPGYMSVGTIQVGSGGTFIDWLVKHWYIPVAIIVIIAGIVTIWR